MKVLVTGGAGFIGSAVCRELERRDITAIPVDRANGTNILTDPLPDGDGVIHLAGVLGTAELFDTPDTAVEVNVKGTLRVLEWAAVEKSPYVGITMPVNSGWVNVYTATKAASQILASAWHRHHGVPVSHVRAYNAFGPGQHTGSPFKIIPTFAHEAYHGRPIPIWGSGEQTADLVYVEDIARMLVDALAYGDDQVFDAGTGQAQTVNNIATRVLEITGSRAGVVHLPMRLGEDPDTKIIAEGEGWATLGWQPEFFDGDLVETVESYRP